MSISEPRQRGAALLAVLWLAAALAAIAFSVATTVRGETERSATDADGLKAYYLACGGVDRMLLYIESPGSYLNPDGKPRFQNTTRMLPLDFPSGFVIGEFIPETSKLDVNGAPPKELTNLLLALGIDPERAQAIVAGILDWRQGTPGGSFSEFDQFYMSLTPSFRARHASVKEIEELLLVRGVTPDLFYGSYTRDAQGRLAPHPGLRDCLSVYGSSGKLDVNTAEPAVMEAIGISPDAVAGIIALRSVAPIHDPSQLAPFQDGGPGVGRLGLETATAKVATIRTTARLRLPNGQLSDLSRSVSALVRFLPQDSALRVPGGPSYHILRWYDDAVRLQ